MGVEIKVMYRSSSFIVAVIASFSAGHVHFSFGSLSILCTLSICRSRNTVYGYYAFTLQKPRFILQVRGPRCEFALLRKRIDHIDPFIEGWNFVPSNGTESHSHRDLASIT